MDFVAFDFETANSSSCSACAIGIAVVEGGKVVENFAELIRPPETRFDRFNIRVHGIHPEHVSEEESLSEMWPRLRPYFEDRTVVAHNVQFDVGVLCATLDHFAVRYPRTNYLCSLALSRRMWPWMPSHRLNQVCAFLGVEFSHHHAGEDAFAVACILIEAARQVGAKSLGELLEALSLRTLPLTRVRRGWQVPPWAHETRM